MEVFILLISCGRCGPKLKLRKYSFFVSSGESISYWWWFFKLWNIRHLFHPRMHNIIRYRICENSKKNILKNNLCNLLISFLFFQVSIRNLIFGKKIFWSCGKRWIYQFIILVSWNFIISRLLMSRGRTKISSH